mgnify:FL=1
MEDWWNDAYEAEQRRRYAEIRSRYPDLVQGHLFSCHQGWFGILERLFGEIEHILKDGDPSRFQLRQVKEKLGGLRVYWRYGSLEKTADGESVRDTDIRDRIMLAVFSAEARSERTCEVCGKPGHMRVQSGWYATRCDEHGADMEVRPPADQQAAFKPQLRFSDGRMFIFDREVDRAVEVHGS